jgi:hypothetical protein
MTPTPLTIDCTLPGPRRDRPRHAPALPRSTPPRPSPPPGRVPRISRLMALALRFDGLVQSGRIADYAALARLGRVSRARITQVMNLLLLAPAIQEALLFLPRSEHGRDPIHLRQLQPLAALLDWRQQRRRWQALLASSGPGQAPERAQP